LKGRLDEKGNESAPRQEANPGQEAQHRETADLRLRKTLTYVVGKVVEDLKTVWPLGELDGGSEENQHWQEAREAQEAQEA